MAPAARELPATRPLPDQEGSGHKDTDDNQGHDIQYKASGSAAAKPMPTDVPASDNVRKRSAASAAERDNDALSTHSIDSVDLELMTQRAKLKKLAADAATRKAEAAEKAL